MQKLRLGINEHLSNADYHADREYFSSSAFKLLMKSAKEFESKYILNEDTEGLSGGFLDEGSLVHAMILEPEVIQEEFAFFPGFRKAGKEFQAFKADNQGKIIISASQQKRCGQYYEAYKKCEAAVKLIDGGKAEESAASILQGVPVKARADYINAKEGYIVDVKTTAFASDQMSFIDTIDRYKYDLSAALYLDVFETIYDKKFDFYFAVISKKEFTCDVFRLSDKSRERGMTALLKTCHKYKRCKESGIWRDEADLKRDALEMDNYEILEV